MVGHEIGFYKEIWLIIPVTLLIWSTDPLHRRITQDLLNKSNLAGSHYSSLKVIKKTACKTWVCGEKSKEFPSLSAYPSPTSSDQTFHCST